MNLRLRQPLNCPHKSAHSLSLATIARGIFMMLLPVILIFFWRIWKAKNDPIAEDVSANSTNGKKKPV
jgi:hypothetical protein